MSYSGGAEKWLKEIITRFGKRNHKLGIIHTDWVPHKKKAKNVILNYAEIHNSKFIKFPRGMPIIDIKHLLTTCRDYDVIYIMAYSPNELLLRMARKLLGKPIIAGFHTIIQPSENIFHRLYEPLFLWGFRGLDALHVLNDQTCRVFNHCPFNKTYFIPNGVDTQSFQINEHKQSTSFNILFSGRFEEEKGIEVLIKIINHINEIIKLKNLKFTICGFGSSEKSIVDLSQKYDNVRYLGFVPTESLPQIYSAANLFLIPSKSEGMPLRLLEAQSCGLPVVGSKIPGILDLVTDGTNGTLVNVDDVDGFIGGVKKYYDYWALSSKKYRKLKEKIREKIVKNYDWEVIIIELEKMFNEIRA